MPKRKIIYILISVVLAAVLVYLGYFLGIKWKGAPEAEKPKILTPQDLGAGSIGEVFAKDEKTGEEKPLVSPTMPPAIFNTTGVVSEIKGDRLIIYSDGYSFADNSQRQITLILTDDTLTFNKNQTSVYFGKEGLKYLKAGIRILVESLENIRGKTEFIVKTINIL